MFHGDHGNCKLKNGCSYTSALQTIALFGLKLHRFPALIGMMAFFILYVSPRSPAAAVASITPCRSFILVVPERKQFSRSKYPPYVISRSILARQMC